MVLCIARQGIHIHRMEHRQDRFIARQGRHINKKEMNALTGNAQNHAGRSIMAPQKKI
jgi:hypothetical protein